MRGRPLAGERVVVATQQLLRLGELEEQLVPAALAVLERAGGQRGGVADRQHDQTVDPFRRHQRRRPGDTRRPSRGRRRAAREMFSASKIATTSATLRPTRYSLTSAGLSESPKPRRSGAIARKPLCVRALTWWRQSVRAIREAVQQQDWQAVADVGHGEFHSVVVDPPHDRAGYGVWRLLNTQAIATVRRHRFKPQCEGKRDARTGRRSHGGGLGRRHAAGRQPVHGRHGGVRQRPRDAARTSRRRSGRPPARWPACPRSRSISPRATSSRPATRRTCWWR